MILYYYLLLVLVLYIWNIKTLFFYNFVFQCFKITISSLEIYNLFILLLHTNNIYFLMSTEKVKIYNLIITASLSCSIIRDKKYKALSKKN